MLPADDLTSLPLAERLYRQQPDLAEGIYSSPVLKFLRDGVLIWHGALIHSGTPMGDPALTRRSDVCHDTAAAGRRRKGMIAGGPTHA